jgi:hypothetical protein
MIFVNKSFSEAKITNATSICLRNTYVVNLLENGISKKLILQIMGYRPNKLFESIVDIYNTTNSN